jgi:hypothetical protein
MMDPVIYRLLKRMAETAQLAIPSASEPFGSNAWVVFFTKLQGHVS